MPLHASWVHGNTLTIESPQNVTGHLLQGWGTTVDLNAGAATWLHIAIPTPVIVRDVRTHAQRFFLLVSIGLEPVITDVHIYDGPSRIHQAVTSLRGNQSSLSTANTFTLPAPHAVRWGTSISFRVQTTDSIHGGHLFTVFSAGADFTA
jgi:hypothetical protein